jgi:dipeptide/tripeptide permease
MGINVGAFLAPVVAEFMKSRFGFHPAFAGGGRGMAISIFILWKFKKHVEMARLFRPARVRRQRRKLPPSRQTLRQGA